MDQYHVGLAATTPPALPLDSRLVLTLLLSNLQVQLLSPFIAWVTPTQRSHEWDGPGTWFVLLMTEAHAVQCFPLLWVLKISPLHQAHSSAFKTVHVRVHINAYFGS